MDVNVRLFYVKRKSEAVKRIFLMWQFMNASCSICITANVILRQKLLSRFSGTQIPSWLTNWKKNKENNKWLGRIDVVIYACIWKWNKNLSQTIYVKLLLYASDRQPWVWSVSCFVVLVARLLSLEQCDVLKVTWVLFYCGYSSIIYNGVMMLCFRIRLAQSSKLLIWLAFPKRCNHWIEIDGLVSN